MLPPAQKSLMLLEQILRVLQQINHQACQQVYKEPCIFGVEKLSNTPLRQSSPIPVYIIFLDRSTFHEETKIPPIVSSMIGVETAEAVFRAWTMHCQCDFSNWCFLAPLTAKLTELGAIIEWLKVKPKYAFMIHSVASEKDVDAEPRWYDHSVLQISTADGEQFIVDFTMAQHGWTSDTVLIPRADYFTKYAWKEGIETPSPTHVNAVGTKSKGYRAYVGMVERYADMLDWDELMKMDAVNRLSFVKDEILVDIADFVKIWERGVRMAVGLGGNVDVDDIVTGTYNDVDSEDSSDDDRPLMD
jgi:hypothetical protein